MTEQEAKLEVIRRCKEDLLFLGKTIMPKAFYLESPPFHRELAQLFTDRSQKKTCVQAPRGYAKSTIGVLAVIDHILFDKGDKVVVIQSKTGKESRKRLQKIKNVLNYSQAFAHLFGFAGEEVASTWNRDMIQTKIDNDQVTIHALGTGQQIRGLLEDDTRVTFLLLDDPEDELNTKTIDAMDHNFDLLLAAIPGLDKRGSRIIIIGTPLNQMCMVERVSKMGGWKFRRYHACNEQTGETLWEEMESFEELMQEKQDLMSVGRVSKWYSERQCEITGDDDQLFEEADLMWYDGWLEMIEGEGFLHITHKNRRKDDKGNWELIELKEEEIIPVNNFLGNDPASSRRPGADYSTSVPVSYSSNKDVYVLEYYEKQVKPTDHARHIYEKFYEIRPKRTHIETVSYQEMLRAMLKELFEDENEFPPGINKKFNPRNDKDDRLQSLQRFTKGRKLWLKPNMHRLISEMLLFPRGRKNLLDGLWYATFYMYPPDHELSDQRDERDLKHFITPEKANGWQTR